MFDAEPPFDPDFLPLDRHDHIGWAVGLACGLVTGAADVEAETLGKLAVFSGVSAYPTRVKCASLPWHALKEALAAEEPNDSRSS